MDINWTMTHLGQYKEKVVCMEFFKSFSMFFILFSALYNKFILEYLCTYSKYKNKHSFPMIGFNMNSNYLLTLQI